MSDEQCLKVFHRCEKCWEKVYACLTHDEYFICPECGGRTLIDKTNFKSKFSLIFRKAFGEKPDKPENN